MEVRGVHGLLKSVDEFIALLNRSIFTHRVICRVVLLDSPTHTEELVVKTLTTVIGSVDEQQAKNCYNTSKQLGQALVVSCMKEHAEFFAQMINR